MDLTKNYPRSVTSQFAGVVQLGRTVDKARAYTEGALGEYHYNCPMDKAIFEFLGVTDPEEFAKEASRLEDGQLERTLRDRYVSKKSGTEIARWNREWLAYGPDPGSEGHQYFVDLRDKVAPGRSDVTTWPDLLDLDEGRDVPRRVAA